MAGFTGNVNDLFKSVFGIYTNVPVFFPGDAKPAKQVEAPKGLQYNNVHPGAVLFDKFGFLISAAGLNFDESGNATESSTGSAQTYDLPATTVVTLNKRKNYVETNIPGKDDSVIELINNGRWDITFRGFVINKENAYPRKVRQQITQVFDVKARLRVYSRLLNDLGIEYVVCTNLEWPEYAGSTNVAPFVLECISNKPVVLELNPL